MGRITLPEAMRLCAEMWDWLSENINKEKKDWPKYAFESSGYSECFACWYAIQTSSRIAGYKSSCSFCPMALVWGDGKPNHCVESKSPYAIWDNRKNFRKLRKEAAKKIADGARKVLAEYNKKRGIKKAV